MVMQRSHYVLRKIKSKLPLSISLVPIVIELLTIEDNLKGGIEKGLILKFSINKAGFFLCQEG
jgi:hypothetical protein